MQRQQGNNYILVRRRYNAQGGGFELIDGTTSRAPHIPFVNDARGIKVDGKQVPQNCRMNQYGFLVANRRIPSLDNALAKKCNPLHSELRFSYGRGYWKG